MSKQPDWSAVEWFIYETTVLVGESSKTQLRVLPRKLSKGELRDNGSWIGRRVTIAESPEPVATVTGCSRKTVLAHLKAGAHPKSIQRLVGEAEQRQAERAKADQHNHYRTWIADLERRKRGELIPSAA